MSALQSLRSQYDKFENDQLLGGAEPLAQLSQLAGDCTQSAEAQTIAVAYALQNFLLVISYHISGRSVRRTEGNFVMKQVQSIVPEIIEFLAANNDDSAQAVRLIARMCETERQIIRRRDE